jgi:hypothetical protein
MMQTALSPVGLAMRNFQFQPHAHRAGTVVFDRLGSRSDPRPGLLPGKNLGNICDTLAGFSSRGFVPTGQSLGAGLPPPPLCETCGGSLISQPVVFLSHRPASDPTPMRKLDREQAEEAPGVFSQRLPR